MIAEKQNAHGNVVSSVQFSPNGALIVSGSSDKTVRVWDAVNFRPHVESEWEQFDKEVKAELPWEEDKVEQWWRNTVTGHEQPNQPSGGVWSL